MHMPVRESAESSVSDHRSARSKGTTHGTLPFGTSGRPRHRGGLLPRRRRLLRPDPGRPRPRRPLLPPAGQRRLRRPPLRPPPRLRPPGHRPPGRPYDPHRARHPTPVQLRPRPPAAGGHRGRVDGRRASFTRDGDEITVTPAPAPSPRGRDFTVSVTYGGVPQALGGPIVFGSAYGWMRTGDGVFVVCEPNAASTWFPSSDHPADKAAYDIRIKAPRGLTAVSNGRLVSTYDKGGSTYTHWRESKPMATYLATATIGKFDVRTGRTPGGIPDLRRRRPRAEERRQRRRLRGHGRRHRPLVAGLRAVPLRGDRRDRRRHAAGRVLAGGAEQARVLGRARREHDRARAGPPVVRRLGERGAVEGHLAQRGLRHLCPVAVGGAPGHPPRPRLLPGRLPGPPRRLPLLADQGRRPAAGTRCSPPPSTSAAR